MDSIAKLIRKSLNDLGYKNGKVKVIPLELNHFDVFVNGLHVGIYDINRETFVD